MKGSEEIHVTLDGTLDQLVLDWRKAAVKDSQPQARAWDIEVNGHEVKDARETGDHILILPAYLVKGENVVKLKFESPISTSGSAVTRYMDREDKSEYIYTLFVPSDASTAFPCFDQPDLKARFQLNVTTPTAWTVVSNTIADRVLFPSDPTANDYAARAELICHEASHQWFGDLVTMRWFDDLWLKEGFATFMAYKAIEKILPQYQGWKIFYQRTKPGAYATDV